MALALSAPALAAGKPAANTGGAKSITYNTATLAGTVNPNGQNTSYYFQYGPTRAYGGQSAIADAGSGGKGVGVEVAIGGLQPITLYHYRLVAVNASGATLGADHTFLTTKVPLSLAIVATPNPVPFAGIVVVQGTLSGTNNAGRQVVLQANVFPYTLGFQNVGNPELTTATGSFSFPILGQAATAHFRVVTTTKPQVISPEVVENVLMRISGHIGHSRKHGYVRFYGSVAPAADGMQVGILKITHGKYVLAGGTVLKHHDAGSSTFSKPIRARRGVYRVLVRITSGAQISTYSQPLVIR
ncbi:MAG TPA: hypothetical protein VGD00_08520 [Solirubrobacteraceae bacterium]